MCMGGSDSDADAVAQQQQQQAAIQQATNQINQAFSGFTPAFYGANTQAYENYAMPQLGQQMQQTQGQLNNQLFNQGLANSSSANKEQSALNQANAQAKTNIANTAIGQTNQLRQQVAGEQQNLISQANVANEPATVAGQALNAASQYSAPSAMPAVGNMFQGFANMYLGNRLNQAYGQSPQYNQAPLLSYTNPLQGSYGP